LAAADFVPARSMARSGQCGAIDDHHILQAKAIASPDPRS
jgi:hypothetical protein